MILVVVGLIIGVNSKFERKASIILLIIGGLFLFREITDLSFRQSNTSSGYHYTWILPDL
ncbi:hypothetical protein [Sphingobacterium spiritivorum]|uniref:hypothetical protein n=1 Tax=Sphingobacterium spiritivorum TaxID=258 RepID=UPI0038D3BD0C